MSLPALPRSPPPLEKESSLQVDLRLLVCRQPVQAMVDLPVPAMPLSQNIHKPYFCAPVWDIYAARGYPSGAHLWKIECISPILILIAALKAYDLLYVDRNELNPDLSCHASNQEAFIFIRVCGAPRGSSSFHPISTRSDRGLEQVGAVKMRSWAAELATDAPAKLPTTTTTTITSV